MFDIGDFGFRFIQIEVNNTCNMKCSFCSLPVRKAENRHMNRDKVLEILESFTHYDGISHVALHNFGEPLLNRNIWDYIDYCRRLNLRSQLVTNGLLLRKNLANLFNHPPDILRISLQILTPQAHEMSRQTKTPFEVYVDEIAECLARIIDEGFRIDEIRTDVAVNDDRYSGLQGYRRLFFHKLGITDSGDPTICSQTVKKLKSELIGFLERVADKSQKFQLSIEHLERNIARFYSGDFQDFSVAYDFGGNHMITYKAFVNGRKRSRFFPVKWASCHSAGIGILADGRVTLCCQDYDGNTTIGNILETQLSSILYQNRNIIDELRSYKKELSVDLCKRCLGSPTKFGSVIKNAVGYIRAVK